MPVHNTTYDCVSMHLLNQALVEDVSFSHEVGDLFFVRLLGLFVGLKNLFQVCQLPVQLVFFLSQTRALIRQS